MQGEADLRDAYVKDYDSYRRRVATLKVSDTRFTRNSTSNSWLTDFASPSAAPHDRRSS